VAQGEVSRAQHQSDLLLSTFIRYIEGMGGDMALCVRFGDQNVIELSVALAELGEEGRYLGAAVLLDPQTLLAFHNSRYGSREERYFAEPAA
jgi:hypothetical protein